LAVNNNNCQHGVAAPSRDMSYLSCAQSFSFSSSLVQSLGYVDNGSLKKSV